MSKKLEEYVVSARLKSIPGWSLRDGMLHKEYVFADFVKAFGFMSQAALVAERMNHHPTWTNVYNRVTVSLITHDADGITERDMELASMLDDIHG